MDINNKIIALEPQVKAMQEQFALAAQNARNMQLQDNATAAFEAVVVVNQLRAALTDEVMNAVFMPLMNTKIGFRTDRDPNRPVKQKDGTYAAPKPYDVKVVRDCLIDALVNGLNSTGNQFNIIAGSMYPTKEGYTSLLKKIGCKYYIMVGQDSQPKDAPFAEILCKINYEYNGEKNSFSVTAVVKKDGFSSADQLRGKAERRAKKTLYEYLTGCDLGDADEESSTSDNSRALERSTQANVKDVDFEQAQAPAQTDAQKSNWREKAANMNKAANPEF